MFLRIERKKIVIYKTILYSVLVLSVAALIAEMLPEVSAKMFVIPALLLIMVTCAIDLYMLKKEEVHNAQEEN
jgi:hypothetical protein